MVYWYNMSEVLISSLKEELERALSLEQQYQKDIESLPEGSVHKRLIGGIEYAYLKVSKKGVVESKCIGRWDDAHIQELVMQMDKKKDKKRRLKKVKEQLKILRRALRGYTS